MTYEHNRNENGFYNIYKNYPDGTSQVRMLIFHQAMRNSTLAPNLLMTAYKLQCQTNLTTSEYVEKYNLY